MALRADSAKTPGRTSGTAEETVIFVHIPKTAGTSLNKVLLRQYYPRIVSFDDAPSFPTVVKQLETQQESQATGIKCITGHIPFGLHRYLEQESRYITLLREPIDRIVSSYYYSYLQPHTRIAQELAALGANLEQYAGSDISPDLANGQVRFLSGVERADGINGKDAASKMDLEAAKLNLDKHFVAFGPTERFDEALLLFGSLLGWSNLHYSRQHVNQRRPRVSDLPMETLRIIQEHNALDIELYEYALQRFEEMIREHGITQTKLKWFRITNRLYGLTHPVAIPAERIGLLNTRGRIVNRITLLLKPMYRIARKVLKGTT